MARKLDTMKIQVISGPAQVIGRPAQVIGGPGWAWSMPPWNQESMRPDEVLGPWDPGWGERAAPGGRRPTFRGSGGGAPGHSTYFGLFWGQFGVGLGRGGGVLFYRRVIVNLPVQVSQLGT